MKVLIAIWEFLKFQTYLGSSMPSRELPSESYKMDISIKYNKDGRVSASELNRLFSGEGHESKT